MGIRRAAFGRFMGNQSSEAARREQMKPVSCWEKQWVIPAGSLPDSEFKVLKWVKVDKVQDFSDDEAEEDAPLVPILDITEAAEIDDEEESTPAGTPTRALLDQDSRVPSEQPADTAETESDTQSPAPGSVPQRGPRKPHPLSMSQLPGDIVDPAEQTTDLDSTMPSAIDGTEDQQEIPLVGAFGEQDEMNLELALMGQPDESVILGMDGAGMAEITQLGDAPVFGASSAGDGIMMSGSILEDGKLAEDGGVDMMLQ